MRSVEEQSGYTYTNRIGSGGWSRVFQAYDDRLRRPVAVKEYLQSVEDSGSLEVFDRECRIAARVGEHPQIATIFAAGVADDTPWLAMQFFEGGSLGQRLRSGKLGLADALRVAISIADILAWAHALEPPVLHRDIKPSNILLDGAGRPALTDFGLACTFDGRSSTTIAAFSLAYAAPEVLGEGRYTVASEVWSLTATLHEMLTGATPFPVGENEGIGVFLDRLRAQPGGLRLPERLPPGLAELIGSGLSVDPSRRPADMAEFATRLRQAERHAGLPITPSLPGPALAVQADDLQVPGRGASMVTRGLAPGQQAAPANDVQAGQVTSPSPPRQPGPAVMLSGPAITADPYEQVTQRRLPGQALPVTSGAARWPSAAARIRQPRWLVLCAVAAGVLLIAAGLVIKGSSGRGARITPAPIAAGLPGGSSATAPPAAPETSVPPALLPAAAVPSAGSPAPGVTPPVAAIGAVGTPGAVVGTPVPGRPASGVPVGSGEGPSSAPAPPVAPKAPAITTSSLPNATVGQEYSKKLAVSGTGPFTWSTLSGSFPGGISLGSDGVLTGKAADPASRNVVLKVQDARGLTATASLSLTVILITGDVTHDGGVDCGDQTQLLADWGGGSGRSDINGDGTVDVHDLSILLSHWGEGQPKDTTSCQKGG